MADEKLKIFVRMIEDGIKINSDSESYQYLERVYSFLSVSVSNEDLIKYKEITSDSNFQLNERVGTAIGFLEGLMQINYSESSNSQKILINNIAKQKANFKDVFIVHGRDNEAKETVARFIQKIDLNPIILHEQPNSGKTIIEKFEMFSNVSYAVVLLTPDDLGGLNHDQEKNSPRARQNVILELGYFIGKLGRNNVCALVKNNIELPSDYHGILYLDFDSKGAWKTKLAQEFVQAKMDIKLEGLL